jgi:hypothetical protein
MDSLAKPWVDFLNLFADELHKHNMILSVFIDGCVRNGLFEPFIHTNAHFTKTGSGQT